MRTRLIALAVFALIGVTAFAPAPFMKSDHGKGGRGGDVLARLQGTWKVAEKTRMGPNGEMMKYSSSQAVIIEKETWRYSSLRGGGVAGGGPGPGAGKGKAKGGFGTSYKIVLDTSRRPVEFRLK